MPEETPTATDPVERAGKRGAQVALLAFLVLSSLFVVSSTWQLAHAVFFEPDTSTSRPPPYGAPALPCAPAAPAQTSPAARP
jgi:hypothetical protein